MHSRVKTELGVGMNPNVVKIADEISKLFVVYFVWGMNKSNPTSDHYYGKALDFMTYGDGTVSKPGPMRDNVGNAIAEYHVIHHKRLDVKYIIWYRRIWYPDGKGWRRYNGTPDPHVNHVHVSYNGKYVPLKTDTKGVIGNMSSEEVFKAVVKFDGIKAPDSFDKDANAKNPTWTMESYLNSIRNQAHSAAQETKALRKEVSELKSLIESLLPEKETPKKTAAKK